MEKMADVVTTVAKRCWPQEWDQFLPSLLDAANLGVSCCPAPPSIPLASRFR